MRRCWKRLARRGDNGAFPPEEVADALVPALEEDCREELSPQFTQKLCSLLRDQEASLFRTDAQLDLEALRNLAGNGIGRVTLDRAIQLAEHGETGLPVAIRSFTDALTDRAARGARQVEEHFCRKSTEARAVNVRTRIEAAIESARPAIGRLALRVLEVEQGPSPTRLKKQGLDEGVMLP